MGHFTKRLNGYVTKMAGNSISEQLIFLTFMGENAPRSPKAKYVDFAA